MYKFKLITFFGLLAFFVAIAAVNPHTGFGQDSNRNNATKLNCDEPPCDAVARGRAAFNDRNLNQIGGNGRACADCHMPSENFQLSPAAARARFDALQAEREHNPNADDPLFRPVDADDFRVNGDNASDFSNLVENGLVRVTMPLPLNVKLIDPATGQPSDETSVDLWRAVMPVLNVAITGPDGVTPIWPPGAPRVPIMGQDPNGPNRQGGYQHDGRFGTLQEQARGALFAHAQVSVEPPARMLDDLAAFQQTLFSSSGVELLADAILSASTPFPDPDPELNEQSVTSQDKAPERSLEGVWLVKITPRNCTTGDPIPTAAFETLFTFHKDGTMLVSFRNNSLVLERTAAHGLWRRDLGWSDYSFKIVHIRRNLTTGLFAGKQESFGTLVLSESGDEFTTDAYTIVYSVDGIPGTPSCSNSVGTRFKLEP